MAFASDSAVVAAFVVLAVVFENVCRLIGLSQRPKREAFLPFGTQVSGFCDESAWWVSSGFLI